MSQDVIPAEAIQVTYALIDEITSEIILNIDHRLQKFEALQVCSSLPAGPCMFIPGTGLYFVYVCVLLCVTLALRRFVSQPFWDSHFTPSSTF